MRQLIKNAHIYHNDMAFKYNDMTTCLISYLNNEHVTIEFNRKYLINGSEKRKIVIILTITQVQGNWYLPLVITQFLYSG